MADIIEVLLPDIGDFHDVEIVEVLVKPGDRVTAEDPLITLESDKASVEIPAPQDGVIGELKVAVGDKVNQGDLILLMTADGATQATGGDAVDAPASADDAEPQVTEQPPPARSQSDTDNAVEASPVVPSQQDIGEPIERKVALPDIGDFAGVEVIEILVKPGEQVEAEQSLLTLESDKATMEIPAPFAGTVKSVEVSVGAKLSEGDLIAIFETRAQTTSAAEPTAAPAREAPADVQISEKTADTSVSARAHGEKEPLRRPVIARPADTPRGKSHASPGVRRFARELGVDLYYVPGTGPKNRILKQDVQAYVKSALANAAPTVAVTTAATALPSMPEVDFTKFGEIEEQPLGRIKKLSGAHLHRAWLNVPHVTQFDDADITELEGFRKAQKDDAAKAGVKLTFMPFLLKAVCAALRRYPQFNSSLSPDGEKLILKKYMHIGVAVDTPNGLMVPVIRDVDKKGIFELAAELGELSGKARDGKLAPGDMQGGCLSISSLGGIGGTQFAPIVNAPEVAILGISRAEMQPKWNGESFQPRLMMPFSLSYDHRVIDGAEGVRFTGYLGQMLGDIRRLLL